MRLLLGIFMSSFLLLGCGSKSRDESTQSMPKSDPIREAIIVEMPNFQECFRKELQGQIRTLKGEATFHFDIDSLGSIHNERISSNMVLEDSLSVCLVNVLGNVQFPRGISKLDVNQPFNFFPSADAN